jgi:hypothetical protein
LEGFDQVNFKFLEPSLFMSASSFKTLDLSNFVENEPVIIKEVPRQIEKETEEKIETFAA